MVVRKVIKGAKKVAKGAAATGRWAIPRKIDPDRQVEKAMKTREVRKAYLDYQGDPKEFRSKLREYIIQENSRNYDMRKFATALDSANKALVPVDAAIDYFTIMGGIGAAAKGIGTLGKIPVYLAYDAYYLGKTGDLAGALKNIAYETASWVSLGSLPHLINYYTHQADKHAAKDGSERFVKSLEESLEKKVDTSEFGQAARKKKKIGLGRLAEAA